MAEPAPAAGVRRPVRRDGAQRRLSDGQLAATGRSVVPIRDAKTGQRVPWVPLRDSQAREGHVHFETPKINRNEEPLLTEEALRAAAARPSWTS